MRARRPVIMGAVIALLGGALLASASQAAQEKGDYIVVLRDTASSATVAARHKKTHDVEVKDLYKNVMNGYSGKIKKSELAALRQDEAVAFIEEDAIASIAKPGGQKPGGKRPKSPPAPSLSWGLDRIDERDLPLDGAFAPWGNGGAGATVYVLDTGVRITHGEFGGRASHGRDVYSADDDSSDCHGHGTHVAGTVGGATYGVAKAVGIVAVRVLSCAGSAPWSTIIAGLDWVVGQPGNRKVVNMSIGGPASDAMDSAVANATQQGVVVVVAAGNENTDACNRSPARAASAVTVGATTSSDARASYSNVGSCLDIFGPGSSITSAWYTSDTASNTISGTSMATPHTAGVGALFLAANPGWPAGQVRDAIVAATTPGKITGISGGTPKVLLYAGN